ncbi:MAG: histidine phosphatase family protein [Kangiellaceae bacterium]|nr:histidine phosphatase family protein [Kangiellaceae bacterium]MCW8998173.1 histidine phosphatase family protein [Kangiellaceae bacterium]MCW9017237.1 histidine phosphatase family protein [Kangiellaceae bacterium]
MKTTLIRLAALLMATLSFAVGAQNIYLVRHAEKAKDGTKDPALTKTGNQRAKNIAKMLKGEKLKYVYSTDYKRTQQTAEPTAKVNGLVIKSYNPRELAKFAEQVKSMQGDMLIVGHSNTTPALVHLLGGDANGDIDDSEYDRIYHLQVADGKVTTRLNRTQPVATKLKVMPISFDANRFSSGTNFYQMSYDKKPVGKSIHRFEQGNDEFRVFEKTIIEAMKIDADIEVAVSNRDLSPKMMAMAGSMGAPVDIQLSMKEFKVSGHSEMVRAAHKKQGKIKVDRKLPTYTYERTSAILLAHLYKVDQESASGFYWYNGYDDEQSYIELSYQGDEKVSVPAGTFETYKVQLLGGAPSQLFYISKEEKPKIVKIEVIAMPWTYELIKSELK